MDIGRLTDDLLHTPLIAICTHEAWATVYPIDDTYRCAAGGTHHVIDNITAGGALAAASRALTDLKNSGHPALLAEYRRRYDELLAVDDQVRKEIDRRASVAAYRSLPASTRFLGGFFGYFRS